MSFLRDHPKFPKLEEEETETCCTCNCYKAGRNQTLRELGELEILEELDEEELLCFFKYKQDKTIKLTIVDERETCKAICSRFGTKKVSVGEIEKIIENWFIEQDKRLTSEQIKEVDKKGLWEADLKSLSFDEIKKGLAIAIVSSINKGG